MIARYEDDTITLYDGDARKVIRELYCGEFDSLITDPPAGIGFMGKAWDTHSKGAFIALLTDVFKLCRLALKPGAHGLIWGIPRTAHWTATALEDAGFEVRDVITHLFGTGFPKSQDIGKALDKRAGAEREVIGPSVYANRGAISAEDSHEGWKRPSHLTHEARQETAPATAEARQWSGWGTALKPAAEFWYLVRAPLAVKTIAGNVLEYGTGGINIDGCRIGTDQIKSHGYSGEDLMGAMKGSGVQGAPDYHFNAGRWPANVVLSHSAECAETCTEDCPVRLLDEQSGVSGSAYRGPSARTRERYFNTGDTHEGASNAPDQYGDSGGASRFFYCAKASTNERGYYNDHPTVKSLALMRYLARLITPPNGSILDPFAGSGSTLLAALMEGYRATGIEIDPHSAGIAERRLKHARMLYGANV